MEHLDNITLLSGIKDKNIILMKAIQHDTHVEVIATLDYPPFKCSYCYCKGKQIKHDFQKVSKISYLYETGYL